MFELSLLYSYQEIIQPTYEYFQLTVSLIPSFHISDNKEADSYIHLFDNNSGLILTQTHIA